jgi:hypothetical protein
LAKFASAPFERAKIVLDTQTTLYDTEEYDGLIDVLTTLTKEQGVLSLWRGNWWYMLRYLPSQATFMTIGHRLNRLFVTFDKKTEYKNYLASKILSGSILAGAALVFTYPVDVRH